MSQPKEENIAKIPGGVDTLAKIWKDMRDRNTDGYVPFCGGLLARFKDDPGFYTPPRNNGTTCSPFVATVVGIAFDPKYPRDDLGGDKYVPLANDGKDLAFHHYYSLAKEKAPQAVVKYGLGTEVGQKELRRGDVIGIDWYPTGGHGAFVWDVHLDANGHVDAIQIISSNSSGAIKIGKNGVGVSVAGCNDKDWFDDPNACAETESVTTTKTVTDKKTKKVKVVESSYVDMKTRGSLKAKPAIFDTSNDEIIKKGTWYTIPDNRPDISTPKKKEAWLATFKVRPENVLVEKAPYSIDKINGCARLHYDGAPPEPLCMRDGPPPPPPKPGHTEAPAVVVKGHDIKSDPKAPQKVPPKPAKQEKDRVVDWQYFAEQALRVFFQKQWIRTSPGKTENIHDSSTQAAIKEFQQLFGLVVDGILGKETVAAMQKHLPAAQEQHEAQKKLRDLNKGKQLSSDPRPVDGTNHAQTNAAVKEFQQKNGLEPTGVPDAHTTAKLAAVHASHAPTANAPGLDPHIEFLYWIGNFVEVGGTATLCMHSVDLKLNEPCDIHLIDEVSEKDVLATVELNVDSPVARVDVPFPPDFLKGARIDAKVITQSAGQRTTVSPMHVGGTELADWRPYVDQDSVPDDVIDKIKRNRAIYPDRKSSFTLIQYEHDKKGQVQLDKDNNPVLLPYGGENHYDYPSTNAHKKWAVDYFQKTQVDPATDRVAKHVAQAWVHMLANEGLPASFQTYDNQIITWGAGFGGMGDGVKVFDEMNKEPKLERLLDDVGMNYVDGRYHVVDVTRKKVISTPKTNTNAHYAPLDAVRQQMDLMSALVGMSEDPTTRTPIAEAQFRVYLQNSASWAGQDKVNGIALYFLITHMHHWLPAMGAAVDVPALWATLGASSPSSETDKQLAQLAANAFVRKAKTKPYKVKYYPDAWWRMRYDDDPNHSTLWKQYKADARDLEKYDAGILTYDSDLEQPAKPWKR